MTDIENPLPWLATRVVSTRYEDLPHNAVGKAKTFLIDTMGVGVAGCHGVGLDSIVKVAGGWGAGAEARVWVSGERLPAPAAAFVNAYQIHSLEYDCVNEAAVLHPMATLLSSLFAYCERRAAQGRPVSGRDFLTACVMGVDVAVFLGKTASAPIRFFRPATAGGFGAAAAIGRLEGFDAETLMRALGNQYGQASGNLQAHAEGSPLLGMQVGFNARAAIASCDFASAGLLGPKDVLTGRYGYFRLYEGDDFDVEHGLSELRSGFEIERMSHKPFPTGRLTHGAVDGLDRLMTAHHFKPDDIESVTCLVPDLVARLVGRADIPSPAPNYAKLCLPFVAGTFLNHGRVDVEHFIGAGMLENARTHELAARITVVKDDNPDPNAMTPQTIAVTLKSGATHEIVLDSVFGHPDRPLSDAQNLDKFWRCWTSTGRLGQAAGETLIGKVQAIEELDDAAHLVDLLVA